MKKFIVLFLSIILLTGCSFTNSDEKKIAYTTYYPFEFAAKYMASDFKDISSIYPSEVDTSNYQLTSKQKEHYSSGDVFIYSGLTKEVDLAVEFLNNNNSLNIVDATRGLNYSNDVAELWLNPSNYLMVARNIKTTLNDYENNLYNQEKIKENYNNLKIAISELDVDYTMMSKNASRNNILVADDTLSYLSKYNINVLSLNAEKETYARDYNEAKKLITNGDIKYIYVIKGKTLTDEINIFIKENNLEKIEIDPMYTLTEDNRKNNEDYLSIMKENIEKFKTELFR